MTVGVGGHFAVQNAKLARNAAPVAQIAQQSGSMTLAHPVLKGEQT